MKIVCDACAAKYSIADDKVKGKVFKIRCKKCSNIIVVRGTAGAAEEPAAAPYDQKETRVYDYGSQDAGAPAPADDAVWHVVIDQEQVGPITVADIQARFAASELDAESYVWREGFTDWLPLSQVPDFAALVAGGSTTHAQSPSSGNDAVASMFGSAAGFEEPAAPARAEVGDVFAAHAAKVAAVADDGGDLFGDVAPPAPEVGGFGGGRAAPQGSPAATAAGMRGQRSENSVLFSLNNLAAMAGDGGRSAPAASASSSGGSAQHGGGEGSGLIDIRSMASSYLGGKAAPARSGSSVGSVDDLPVFSTATFHEPAVIMPVSGGARNNNKTLYILLGAVGLLAAVAVVLVVVMLSRNKGTNTTTAAAANAGKGPGSDLVATGPGSAEPPVPPPGGGTAAGSSATGDLPPGGGSGSGSSATGELPPGGGSATDPGTPPVTSPEKPIKPTPPEKPTKPERTTTPEKPTKPEKVVIPPEKPTKPERVVIPPVKPEKVSGGGCIDEVACLLADPKPACCLKKAPKATTTTIAPPPPVNTSLPEQLGKSDISDGIAKVRSKVDACASKSPAKGTVKVSVKVAGSGTVSSVTVKESPDGALGSCVAAAVQKATFAKTQTGATFSYPFKF